MLGVLAGRSSPLRVETLGEDSAILAVSLGDAGLAREAWERLERAAPRTFSGAIPADWLAHHAARGSTPRLARRYGEDVGLRRASAELLMTEDELLDRLDGVAGPDRKIARQLRQGLVTRAQWESLLQALDGSALPGIPSSAGSRRLALGVWTDRTVYRQGDLATVTALASEDCYLTLIGIDRSGYATVLFPNEFEPSNFIRGASSLTIPLRSATYQLRVRQPGTETVVGICDTRRWRPRGILHDFETQRFTALGNWRVFLHTADSLEADFARTDGETARRNRNGGEARATGDPGREARTAVEFTVE
jgi:hypothetical protein